MHLRLDLRAELGDLELAIEDHEHGAQALLDVVELEQLLLLLGLQPQGRGHEVAEGARLVDVRGGERKLLGQIRHEPDQAREEVLHVLLQRLGLGRFLDRRPEPPRTRPTRYGSSWTWLDEADPADPLDEDPQRAVGNADHLLYDRGGADLVQVVPAGLLDVVVLRSDQGDQPVARDDFVHELDRPFLADREREHGVGEDDRVLQGQDR